MTLRAEAFDRARQALRRCVTPRGFTACDLAKDDEPGSNYRSVWARDSAKTAVFCLGLEDPQLDDAGRASLDTLLAHQGPGGQVPNYVSVDTGEPEFGGVGNIAGVDSALWMILAVAAYVRARDDLALLRRHRAALERIMAFLVALDSNQCGLLEVPEASDWTDILGRHHNVLYDQVLWVRANEVYAEVMERLDAAPPASGPSDVAPPPSADAAPPAPLAATTPAAARQRAAAARAALLDRFWPSPQVPRDPRTAFSETQHSMGSCEYLLAQLSPFSFDWRCDVYANSLAGLFGLLDRARAERFVRYAHGVGADHPYPVRVLYPVITPGDPQWRDYFLVKLHNLPHHYHNGGIWPLAGGCWVRLRAALGQRAEAERALEGLAEVCAAGARDPWEFTEWAHGQTGRPMGKAGQAWSAASYVAAHLALEGVPGALEVALSTT